MPEMKTAPFRAWLALVFLILQVRRAHNWLILQSLTFSYFYHPTFLVFFSQRR